MRFVLLLVLMSGCVAESDLRCLDPDVDCAADAPPVEVPSLNTGGQWATSSR